MIQQIQTIWDKVSRTGLKDNEGFENHREIILLNKILGIAPVVMLFYIPVEILYNGFDLIPALFLLMVLMIIPLIFNKFRYFKTAKRLTIGLGALFIFFAGLSVGKGIHNHVNFIPILLISILLLKSRTESLIVFFSICFLYILQQYLFNHIEPIFDIKVEQREKFAQIFFILGLFLTLIVGRYFLNINFEFEKIINSQKVALQNKADEIELKHKEITDSINYAERIQRSFLASKELLDENLSDYFVFFKPKDVVSGDFYFASQLNNSNFAFCCADSTGHGVPGAIMSILNISSLEKAIEKENQPHHILSNTRELIIERLKKDGSPEGGKDGMDCSLLVLNQDKSLLTFASANNPVFIIRPRPTTGKEVNENENNLEQQTTNFKLIEYKGDKMPVGKHDKDQTPFTLQAVPLQKGDLIYTLTDGMPDQFGGEKGKKYMIKNLKNLFLAIAHLPMAEQYTKLEEEFTKWKGENEQVDDVCIIGLRV